MSKVVCIYPQDLTTDFLRPLCDHICATFDAVEVGYDTSGDDDPLELIYNEIGDAKIVFFLGHGMSTCLYASTLDNVELFNKDTISLLEGKCLFLLACDSGQFITKYNIANAIGFAIKNLYFYSQNTEGGAKFRNVISQCKTKDEILLIAKNFFDKP